MAPSIEIIRPVNIALTIATIFFIGVSVAGIGSDKIGLILIAALSAGLIGAGANAHNDACDIEIDRINRPDRPVASGRITVEHALRTGYLLMFAGAALSMALPFLCAVIALSTVILLILYNRYLKKTALWGNLTVSAITASALVYTGAAVGSLQPVLLPAVFAFFIHLAREIVKDMEDIEGDRQQGAKTFPVRFGLKNSAALFTAVILVLIAVTAWAGLSGQYQPIFLWTVAAGIYPLLLFSVIFIWRKPGKTTYHRLSQWLKIGMAIGLIAILLGQTMNHIAH